MLCVGISKAQYLRTQTGQQHNQRVVTTDTINQNSSVQEKTTIQQFDTTQKGYYKWENPLFGDINVALLDQYSVGSDAYMQQLKIFENTFKSNEDVQKELYTQLKKEEKIFKQDKKNWKEKRRFYREDEKLLKRERKLNERELKIIAKERKELSKNAKKMDSQYVVYQNNKLDEREQRVAITTEKWNKKKDVLQQNITTVTNEKQMLDKRKVALKERKAVLRQNDQELKLQKDIIKLKSKQAKLEIEKIKFRQQQK